MLGKVCVCIHDYMCVYETKRERERDLECNGRSRRCSIQGGKAKLTVSQTLFLSLRPLPPSFHFHSPLLLPLSALKQLPPLMQGTFQMTGGREKKGMGGGACRRSKGGGKQKVARWLHNDSKAAEGGHSSLGEDAFPSSFSSSSSCSKNPRCYTSKRRRLTARHSNLCNRTVF